MSDSLQSHGLLHIRLHCPSLSPGFCSDSCLLSQWCYPTNSSSVILFSSCCQIFPSIRVFSNELALCIRWPKYWSFRFTSVLPMNIQGWFPLGLTSLISLLSKGLSRVFFDTTVQKHHFFSTQPSLWSNSHIHTRLLEKPQFWPYRSLSAKWYLCFLIHCLGLSLLLFPETSVF